MPEPASSRPPAGGDTDADFGRAVALCRQRLAEALAGTVPPDDWLALYHDLDRTLRDDAGRTAVVAAALLEVMRDGALRPPPARERTAAARLLGALNFFGPICKAMPDADLDEIALFALAHGDGPAPERLTGFATKHRRVWRLGTLAARQLADGGLTAAQVRTVAVRTGLNPRLLEAAATELAGAGALGALFALFVDAGALEVPAASLRPVVEHLQRDGQPHLLAEILRRLPHLAGAGDVERPAAAALGLPTLALARGVARAGAAVDAATAITLHHDLLSLGHAGEAARTLSAHVGDSADAAMRAGKLAERRATPEAAVQVWQAALARWPEDRFRAGLGRCLAAALQLEAAEEVLWGLVERHPDRPGYWRDLARAFQEAGDWDAWSDCLGAAHRAVPDDPWIAHAVRWADSERGRVGAITDDAESTLDDLHSARMLAGRLAVEARYGEAVDLRRLIRERTQDRRDNHHYVLALFQAGRFDAAAAEVERCIGRFPGEALFYVKRAQVCERRLEWAAALEAFAQARALDPANAEASPGIARCLAYLGRRDALELWLRRFPDADVRFGWVHAMRAFGAAMAGDAAAARTALQPLYAATRAFRADCEAMMRRRPATVWTPDGPRAHPLRRAAHDNESFLGVLRRIDEAAGVVLVGNAPCVLGAGLGRRIDAHDCVIRLNDFRTLGFEADVGSRTSLWYTRAHRLSRPDPASLGEAHILAQNDTLNQHPPVDEYLRGRLRIDVPVGRASLLPSYARVATDGATYPKPTTGFRVIQMLDFFVQRDFDIVGFEFFKGRGMHYFDVGEDRLKVGEMHAVDFERDFVQRVLLEGGFANRL